MLKVYILIKMEKNNQFYNEKGLFTFYLELEKEDRQNDNQPKYNRNTSLNREPSINQSSSIHTIECSGTDRIGAIDKFLRRCRISKHQKKKTDENQKINFCSSKTEGQKIPKVFDKREQNLDENKENQISGRRYETYGEQNEKFEERIRQKNLKEDHVLINIKSFSYNACEIDSGRKKRDCLDLAHILEKNKSKFEEEKYKNRYKLPTIESIPRFPERKRPTRKKLSKQCYQKSYIDFNKLKQMMIEERQMNDSISKVNMNNVLSYELLERWPRKKALVKNVQNKP